MKRARPKDVAARRRWADQFMAAADRLQDYIDYLRMFDNVPEAEAAVRAMRMREELLQRAKDIRRGLSSEDRR